MPRKALPPDPAERARILAATIDVIAEKGLAGAKVSDIADRAGVAYGTLYRHFPTRSEVLLAAIREVTAAFEDAQEQASECLDPRQRVIKLCLDPIRLLNAAPELRDVYTSVVHGGPSALPGAAQAIRRTGLLSRQRLESAILDAQAVGYFGDFDHDVLAVTLMGIALAYMSTTFVPEDQDWLRVEWEAELIVMTLAGDGSGSPGTRRFDGASLALG